MSETPFSLVSLATTLLNFGIARIVTKVSSEMFQDDIPFFRNNNVLTVFSAGPECLIQIQVKGAPFVGAA